MSNASAADFYKCTINGSITYQGEPCPTSEPPVKRPTVEQLNAERQKKLRDMGASAASEPAPAPRTGGGLVAPRASASAAWPSLPQVAPARSVAVPHRAPSPASAFRCDGRKHCSQMRSCAEAEFFLANCLGVKMDGDLDGIPCEEQWCGHQ
ncbi:MAG: excalibur calcium-binding domain-containing protein [Burkholderiales bacterium]|nr:excalibur calcium-binding domain-containing protein [Burkholderiales bacterium]